MGEYQNLFTRLTHNSKMSTDTAILNARRFTNSNPLCRCVTMRHSAKGTTGAQNKIQNVVELTFRRQMPTNPC